MIDSILTSVKQNLGVSEAVTAFDNEILTHINSVFSTLQQLGVGPDGGIFVEDASTLWSEYLPPGDNRFNAVRTYMHLRVRLLYDPPATSFHIEAITRQVQELEWRLNVDREEDSWVDPNVVPST